MSKDKEAVVYERMKVSDLRIHPTAQRKITRAGVKKISAVFDKRTVGTLTTVRYPINGVTANWIVDGQHRHAVLMQLGMADFEVMVACHSYVKTHAEASNLFLNLNNRTQPSAYAEFVNELQRGDEVAVAIQRIANEHGLRIDSSSGDGLLSCVNSLRSVYNRDNGLALSKALDAVTTAWGRTAGAVEGKLIEGIGLVFYNFNGEVDRESFVKKLAKFPGGASSMLGSAKGLHDHLRGKTLSRCVAEVAIDLYNKGRRTNTLFSL